MPLPALDSADPALHGGGALKRKSLSWAHTDTGGTDSCMFPGSLDLANLCGLGHLTVLSAQAGRENGIFNRLPICSDRKLLMPHLQFVSGGKCANSPSEHLICVLLAHSARSLRGWQFSSGNGSTCISHCQGPLKAPCALLFSRAPFFCPGLGTKGTAALEAGTGAGLASVPRMVPLLALSPAAPRPVIADSSWSLQLASPLPSKTWSFCAVPTRPEMVPLVGIPHITPQYLGLVQHEVPLGDLFPDSAPETLH